MRKRAKEMSTDAPRRTRRFQVMGVIAVVIVFAIAAMAISMNASSEPDVSGEKKSPRAESNSGGNGQPLRAAQNGQTDVPSFSQAQIRPLTQEEAQRMAEGLKTLLNQSTDDLKQVRHADGSVSIDLQGRLQNVALAKKSADGTVLQSCVDNPEAAAAFLGIDRELIDGIKSPSKPARLADSGGHN